ncbi:uncharacterized protein [Euwallacea similis]|uniref:uncharacterized protein n=1 Tax=Euwallacea similis TaxID=1736056 RepID=UPI00344C9A7B
MQSNLHNYLTVLESTPSAYCHVKRLKTCHEDLQKFIDALNKFFENEDTSTINSLDIIKDFIDDLLENVKIRKAEVELDLEKLRHETIDLGTDGEHGSLELTDEQFQDLTATLLDENVTVRLK